MRHRPHIAPGKHAEHRFCIDAWQQTLAQMRTALSRSAQSGETRELASVRAEFQQLAQRSRSLLGDGRLKDEKMAGVRCIGARALEISKLMYEELRRAESPEQPVAPGELLRELLGVNKELIDRVERQLWLSHSTDQHAEHLHEAVCELLSTQMVASARLRNVTRRIVVEVRDLARPTDIVPERHLLSFRMTERRRWDSDPFVYGSGIQTARLVALVGLCWREPPERLETMTMAALLQDAGFLILEKTCGMPPEELAIKEPLVYSRHCELGAALSAGVLGFSVDLPRLVAQHHERSDGTGFPEGITSRRLNQASRALQVANRFVECIDESNAAASDRAIGENGEACLLAGLQICAEARQRELDRCWTGRLLEALDPELDDRLEAMFRDGTVPMQAFPKTDSLRLHPAHYRSHPSTGTAPPLRREAVPTPNIRRRGSHQSRSRGIGSGPSRATRHG